MYLVYEKNYLNYDSVDCVDEKEMKLFIAKEDAMKDMERRKVAYMEDEDNGFTYMEDESSENCIVFADELSEDESSRAGEFRICVAELAVQ